MQETHTQIESNPALALLSPPVRAWFGDTFAQGPTPAQALAWPAIAAGEHVLLISPTGTGKTLSAFLAILDRLFREHTARILAPGLRCVYVSPLRSLSYDVEKNLKLPLDEISRRLDCEQSPIRIGVRTGDTSARDRQKLRLDPPHILITTPESLSLLLSQANWLEHWRRVEHIIVDEVHALVPTKRGADLAVSLERLAARAARDPERIGLSATCLPHELIARYLLGTVRTGSIVDAQRWPGKLTGGRACREPATQGGTGAISQWGGPLCPPVSSSEGALLGRRSADKLNDFPPAHAASAVRSPAPARLAIAVNSLIEAGEAPHRGLSYRRLLRLLHECIARNRTTVVFANTRAFAEKLTHDLRKAGISQGESRVAVAAHHSALDASQRRSTEAALKSGELRAVITSTSLELGVDIGTADLVVQVGLPGSIARCVQRIGRSGHRPGFSSRGILAASTPAELTGAIVTVRAACAGEIEPLRMIDSPLDVVCQQLVGMACSGEQSVDAAWALFRRTAPMAGLSQADFQACLDYLSGQLPGPPGAGEPEPGAAPRWTSPRLWHREGRFGLRSRRVARWFWMNVGTIHSEESVRVLVGGVAIGMLEASYAERLVAGDRFVLDGRALEVRRLEGSILIARPTGGEPNLPRWTSDRQTLSSELARDLAEFRVQAAMRFVDAGPNGLRHWLSKEFDLEIGAADVLVELFEAQVQWSEVPETDMVLVEESPSPTGDGTTYSFHVPLHRSACEALGRAIAARLGRRVGRNLSLAVADLGWSIRLPGDLVLADGLGIIETLFDLECFEEDVLEGLDRGELLARRFRQVAATALMILDNPEPGRRVRVGGLHWASTRLYPLIKTVCPDHPLLRETRREVLNDLLDTPAAISWIERKPRLRFRSLSSLSPFAAAWIEPGNSEPLQFESAASALRRLHARLVGSAMERAR
jgi:ATP-dependent Lhr-like helicase